MNPEQYEAIDHVTDADRRQQTATLIRESFEQVTAGMNSLSSALDRTGNILEDMRPWMGAK